MATAFSAGAIIKEAQQMTLTKAQYNALSASEQAQIAAAVQQLNLQYMRNTTRQYALVPYNGGADTASYSSSNTSVMSFNIPQSASGWAEAIVIDTSLAVDYTPAASSPTIALNAGAPWNIYQQMTISFGSTTLQIDLKPYFQKMRNYMRRYLGQLNGQTSGNQVTSITNKLYSGITTNSGTNNWKVRMIIPLNAVHPLSMEGMLPAMGNTGKAVVRLQPAQNFVGVDPVLSVINTNGTVTATGTTEVKMIFRNGTSMSTTNQLAPVVIGPAGIGTVQYVQLENKNNLVSTQYQMQAISTTLPVYQLVACVIDGNQSSSFSAIDNVVGFELALDQNGQNVIWKYDNSEFTTMDDYYQHIRDFYGQDMDEGTFIVNDAASQYVINPSNQDGSQYLNMTSNGYTAANVGFKLNSVGGVSGINPRYELWAVVVNPAGLVVGNS